MLEVLGTHAINADDPPRFWVAHPLGAMRQFRADPLRFVLAVHERCGDVARFRLAHNNCYLLRHPDHIRHVLLENHLNYGKQTLGYKKMSLFLGKGLVTSEGDFWKRQRRIAQPAFHRKRISDFADTMATMADEMVAAWNARIPREGGEAVDVHHEMMAVTLRIIASTVLSVDVGEREAKVGEAVSTLLEVFNDSLTRVVPIHEILPTATNKRWEAARNYLDGIVYRTIEDRRGDPDGGRKGDLLDMLLHAVDEETGESMSDLQLRDEVMTMFMAGHETTANALAWTLYELARHPDILERLQAEADAVLPEGRRPNFDDLPALEYTGWVINEGMRLHPPAWLIARSASEDDSVGRYRIRKGSIVFFSPYAAHRNPTYWPDPERFDPERFSPEQSEHRPRYAYFPFSGGPRVCIGNHFAEMEAKMILACIARDYDVALDASTEVLPDASVTLRPENGLRLRLTPRASKAARPARSA